MYYTISFVFFGPLVVEFSTILNKGSLQLQKSAVELSTDKCFSA